MWNKFEKYNKGVKIYNMENIIRDLKTNEQIINKLVLSDTKLDIKKIIAKKIKLKDEIKWQIEKYIGAQVFHSNVDFDVILALNFSDFKQVLIEKEGITSIYSKCKDSYKVKNRKNDIKLIISGNNRDKNYLINAGDDIPVLVDLGIFSKDKKIINSMYDKFKQINKFIEIIDEEFKNKTMDKITILDFGCGKSYLTFLIYHYFVKIKKIKAKIIGYDLKVKVVQDCNILAKKYGYDGLNFVVGDVKDENLYKDKVDMMITLHACDTATDYALDFAIKNNIKYIFSVPCCQHEINLSIKVGGDFDIFLKDGLFKERFSALLTDALRVEMLRSKGYSVDVIQFVDFAHTPKNLMIRATKNSNIKSNKTLFELKSKYKFKQMLLEKNND